MENGGGKITKIKLYKCGYCVNNMAHIMKKSKNEKIKFPALVVLIEHSKYGNILYDTGYSKDVYNNGFISKIYNLVNRTYVAEEDSIINKLKKDNVGKINKIILSHAHPDHIGGLKLFKNYELLATEKVLKALEKPRIKDLVFKNMLPTDDISKKEISLLNNNNFLNKYFDETYDVLGDNSIIGVVLDGHANGQLGIYIEEYKLFFVADSSWGEQFVDNIEKMKILPRLIQNNFKKYRTTIEKLKLIKKDFPEIEIIFSHGNFEEMIYDK